MNAGLRSSDGFELLRCQIILASTRGEHAIAIAQYVGCSDEAVREAIKAFNLRGLQALKPSSRRPHKTQVAFGVQQAERLKSGHIAADGREMSRTKHWLTNPDPEYSRKKSVETG